MEMGEIGRLGLFLLCRTKLLVQTGTGENNEPPGLYRLEVVHDKGKILMFGGGTPDYVQGFEKVILLITLIFSLDVLL